MKKHAGQMVKKKYFLVYIDILGFEERAEKEAEKSSIRPEEVRGIYRERIKHMLNQLKENETVLDYREISLDSWLLFTKNIWKAFRGVGEVLRTDLDFEVAIGAKEFVEPSAELLELRNETMDYLKNDILSPYKKWYEEKHKEYLFCMKPYYAEYLKDGTVDDKVKKKFKDNRQPLPGKAKVSTIDENHWGIVDGEKEYRIENTGTELNIYYKKSVEQTFILLTPEAYEELESKKVKRIARKPFKSADFYLLDQGEFDRKLAVLEFLEKIGLQRIEYREIEELYVKPENYEEIEKIMKDNNIVFIIGDAEIGKTYTAIKLLFEFFKEEYEPIYIPEEKRREQWVFVRHTTELEGKAVYLEDPWGKVEFDTAGSLFRDIGDLILCAKRERCKIIVTSREKVFEEFEKRKETAGDLRRYVSNLKVNLAYSEEKLSEVLRRYIEIFEPAWHDNKKLKAIAFEAVGEELMTPMSIKRLIEHTEDIVDKESLEKEIEKAAEDTKIAFAREIKEMFNRGQYDKVIFLSFAYINVDVDVAKLCYESILKDLGYDLIKAKDFDDLLEEFNEVECSFFPSYLFRTRRITITLTESTKTPWASKLTSLLSEIDSIKAIDKATQEQITMLCLNDIVHSKSTSGTLEEKNRLNYVHPSYWDAFRYALVDNSKPNNICKKIFSKVLFKLSKEDTAMFDVIDAIIGDFDRLPEDVRNLLFTLSEKNEIADKIANRMRWEFDEFPEDARNKLLLKLSRKSELADSIIRIVKINYDRLPEDVRNLVLEKEDYLTYA